MAWIADLSLVPEAQTLMNMSQVRFITVEKAEGGLLLVTLHFDSEQAIGLNMSRESYSDLQRILNVRDVS